MMTKRYLVPATLTDEQCDTLEEALLEAEGFRDTFDKWHVICRAIGMTINAGEMEVVGFIGARTFGEWDPSGVRGIYRLRQAHDDTALVRQSDASAEIASRDTKIAELTAHMETVISFDEAYRRKVARRVLPAAMGDMMKIANLIEWAKKIHDQFGNTCIYAVDLSWGAVALNREADDRERLSPSKSSWTDNPDFEGADQEAAFAALKEESADLQAENDRLREALTTIANIQLCPIAVSDAYRAVSTAQRALSHQPPPGRTDRERLDGMPAAIAQAVAELPDRSSPCEAPDMMLVTADELASIVRAAIDAAMNREGRGDV